MDQKLYNLFKEFQQTWPLERVKKMTLEEYTSLGSRESFCYWVERKLDKWGRITGGSSFTFGIYAYNNRPNDREHYQSDDTYAWTSKYGVTAQAAFESIRAIIVQIIEAVQTKHIERIDELDFGHTLRWKIAFHYQDIEHPQIVPIFRRDWLEQLLPEMPNKTVTSQLYEELIRQKPANQDMKTYSDELGKQLWNKEEELIAVNGLEELYPAFVKLCKQVPTDANNANLLELCKQALRLQHASERRAEADVLIAEDTALNQFARKVFIELQKEDKCAALEPYLMQQPNSDWTYYKDETCSFGIGGPTYNKNMMFDPLDEIGNRKLYIGSLWRFKDAKDGTPYYDLLPYVINKCYSQKFELVREPAGEGDGRAKYVFKMIRKTVVANSYTKYLRALRTKPFLLLAGISGTGKSRIVRELAFHSCPKELRDADGTTPGNYCMIEVKPNWHDSSELLGYYSNITHTFHSTKFIDFLRKAKDYPEVPFFVCLDEMNLAPVEQYFAEFLSVLETRALPKDNQDHFVSGELVSCENMRMLGDTEALTLPDNVFVIGTVNMDDTTYQFSRKVIDRAMTIEMNGGKLSDMFGRAHELEYPAEDEDVWTMNDKLFGRFLQADDVLEAYAEYADQIRKVLPDKLNQVNDVLKGTPFEVSYRVLNELTLYLATLLDEGMNFDAAVDTAFDQIVLMKILPRIEGDEDVFAIQGGAKNRLEKLMEVMPQTSDSWAKLDEMNKRLSSGFTRFWP